MEFTSRKTPKSQHSAIRHNPYASGGKKFLVNFQKNIDKRAVSVNVTPPRKYGITKYRKYESEKASRYKSISRANNNQNSYSQKSFKENVRNSPWLSKENGFESPAKPCKRPLKSINHANIISDPYNVFSDDEDDDDAFLSSKHCKTVDKNVDKENSIFAINKLSPIVNPVNSSKKRKQTPILKSKILFDVSPEKLELKLEPEKVNQTISERKVFKFKSFNGNGKENESVENEGESNFIEIHSPHMIGFPNFGNTCYLNAVLQTIVSLPPFIMDLSSSVQTMNVSSSSLAFSLWNIIVARQKTDSLAIINSLRTMKENVEKIDESFSGYKMQDANEFLTQVLDTIKDEINGQHKQVAAIEENCNNYLFTPEKLPSLINLTSEEKSISIGTHAKRNIFSISNTSSPSTSISEDEKILCVSREEIVTPDQEEKILYLSKDENITPDKMLSPLVVNNKQEMDTNKQDFINPVTNNFEFELFESFRCLGCGETEGRRQKHFALYVDLPVEDSNSIQEAVESYMSEDQRELTCEKCEHNRASFLTSFVELPRILIVQMKRYKYNFEKLECIKVSSKVDVNMWLHLDKMTQNAVSVPPKFVRKPVRYHKKDAKVCTLSVRNLESELNICSNSTPTKNDSTENTSKDNEDEELQEVLRRSVEDFGGDGSQKAESEPDKEEEELQMAIRLSLQDIKMNFVEEDQTDESENIQDSDGEENENIGMHSYRLISVISHFGLTTTTGHYVSDVLKCDENKWFHYDDETVTSLSESVVNAEGRQKNGYIFFYIHRHLYNDIRNQNT